MLQINNISIASFSKAILLARYFESDTPRKAFSRKFKVGFHRLFLFLVSAILISQITAQAQYTPVRTPQNVTVNRNLPKNILSPEEAMPATFSKEPTDKEIFRVHFFEEPLVPMEGKAFSEENKALVYALVAFSQRKSPDDFTTITKFLKEYPQSRWRGALLANLGIVYRRTGYYNEAMDAWQEAWDLMKVQNDHKVKVLADRVLSELLLINAWVGRAAKIESLLKEIANRIIEGPAGSRVVIIRQALWTMKNKPGISFKCGPYALNKIFTIKDSTKPFNENFMEVQSTGKGFSLAELEKMAQDAGLDYQMAFRKAGADVIVNSVIHWKLNHYSALVKKDSLHYKCEDATMGTVYGQQFWLTPAALDSSASGYFLVPNKPLPAGWRKVMQDEGSKVFGKGVEPPDDGKHISSCDPQSGGGCCGGSGAGGSGGGAGPSNEAGMAQSNVHLGAVSLHIFDRPLFYIPPRGPSIMWDLDYHHRDSYQPANFSYSNMGPKWTFEWLSYVQDDPNNPSANADVYLMGGGARSFTSFNSGTQSYAPELQSNDVLVRICATCYELRHSDGSKEVYARPDGSTVSGRKIFLTKKVDAAGNTITILYDANLRITALQDAIGQVTTLSYQNASDIYKITKITDPFGRSATIGYDGSGRLNSITDVIGIVSSFQYDPYQSGDFIIQMTTPYGNTKFFKVEGPGSFRSLETHYPLGAKERVDFADNVSAVPFSESVYPTAPMNVLNTWLSYRNTFYWDRKAMLEDAGDYSKAKIYHWLHGSSATGEDGYIAPILESIKEPLENRVWYNYQGQTWQIGANQGMSAQPSIIGRVLDDGTSQFTQYTYNSLGAVTSSIDPAGRKLTYIYDTNQIDLLEVRQTTNGANELLAKFTYNSQHLPLTETDASGLTTYYTYNAAGQLKTIKNPKNEITTRTYDATGYMKSITGPVPGSTVTFTYDGYGRVRIITDPEGYKITTDYDVLNRPTLITYPDSTFEQIVYNKLDAAHRRDRLGRWSHTIYDSLQRPNVIQDALGRITQLIWCNCGSLAEIVDPLRQITTFEYDLQGRMTSKIYHDGKTIAYKYENTTSRLKEVTDAKGQTTKYNYFIDDNLKQIDYVNAVVVTPSVIFSYDDKYNRTDTMIDGTGITAYTYYPITGTPAPGAGKLASVDGPLSNDVIAYTYDSLGREKTRSINGVGSSVVYDAMGRVTSASNALGTFGYSYVNQTSRLSNITLPNGQSTVYTYFNNLGDQRLKQIWNKKGSTTISKFTYEYDDEGQITKWTQQAGTIPPLYYQFGYDLADQLTSATRKFQNTGALQVRYAYQYDKGGNRTSEQTNNSVTSAVYNNLNQMTAQQSGGPMRFKGTLSEFASTKVFNQTVADTAIAAVDTTNSFEAFAKVISGNNNISITATDYSGNNNSQTNNYNISVTNGINNTLSFDDNGNTISATNPAVSYDWDAANRLVKITKGANITEFIYDGLSRRVAEKLNGTVIKRWLWCGTQMCEERNASGVTVTKRFFSQGQQNGSTKYFYTRDHLGSIREMTDVNGAVKALYDYDPYGRRTRITGNIDADFGFTGHYYHSSSKLYLAMYRAYDGNMGRWLSRDPIDERGGFNLYAYITNNVVNNIDPYGTDNVSICYRDMQIPILPYKHCFVYNGASSPIDPKNTASFDFPGNGGKPDPEPNRHNSTKCPKLHQVEWKCVQREYQQCTNWTPFNNCCTCAYSAILNCGGKPTKDDFPPENNGLGLPFPPTPKPPSPEPLPGPLNWTDIGRKI